MANRKRNTRVRNRRSRNAGKEELLNPELHETSRPAGKGRIRKERRAIDDQWQTLNAKIGVLEDFITGSVVREEKRRRQKQANILPPPETAGRGAPADRRMGRWEARNHFGRRERHGLTFLLLLGGVCALLYWLVQNAGI